MSTARPFVAVVAQDEIEVCQQALEAGAAAYLSKPLSDEILIEAVNK